VIPVRAAPEPTEFDEKVRKPGLRALAERVGETPAFPRNKGKPFMKVAERREEIPADMMPTYWDRALDDLMDAYRRVCAYACLRIHEVTGARSVDHMAPKSRAWDRVYEWSNYRLACSWMNARKRDFGDVVDPFEVQGGWFELEFVGFQVRPGSGIDEGARSRVADTIARLDLNGHRFRAARERDYDNYLAGRVSMEVLEEESPFVAREIRRREIAPLP
jgi:hypothetical protein